MGVLPAHRLTDRTTWRWPPLRSFSIILCLLIAAGYFVFLLPISKPFPFTDDWMYLDIAGADWRDTIRWLLHQHNDHRIVVIKAIQLPALKLSGYDYRTLIGINVVAAVIGASCLLFAAERFRGHIHFGDLIIPLMVLNFGFALFAWAVSATFVFPVALSAAFIALKGRATADQSMAFCAGAYCALLACTGLGVNGLVIASIVSTGMIVASFMVAKSPIALLSRCASVLILIVCVTIWLLWTPSNASLRTMDSFRAIDWAYQLSKSSFVVIASWGGWSLSLLTVALVCLAIGYIVRSVRHRRPHDLFDLSLYVMLVAHLALVATIVFGRGGHSEWLVGMEMHYGYLLVPIPIIAWIIISREARRFVFVTAIGALLVVLYAKAFFFNAKWRSSELWSSQPRVAEVMAAVRSDMPAQEVTARYIDEFYYLDGPEYRVSVEEGIQRLRAIGGPLYSSATSQQRPQ